jgi:hypothetical protein
MEASIKKSAGAVVLLDGKSIVDFMIDEEFCVQKSRSRSPRISWMRSSETWTKGLPLGDLAPTHDDFISCSDQ